MYSSGVDVPVTELRAQLGDWVDRARAGENIVITDRGVPVARLVGLDTATTIEQLTADGVTGRPKAKAKGSVSDHVSTQRR